MRQQIVAGKNTVGQPGSRDIRNSITDINNAVALFFIQDVVGLFETGHQLGTGWANIPDCNAVMVELGYSGNDFNVIQSEVV